MALLGNTKITSLSLLDGIIGDLNPKVTTTYNLGTSSLKWSNVYATTFNGTLSGNAATATALTSNAGSSTVPIYFSGGKPVQCSTTLGVSITGNAATATKLATARNIALTGAVTGNANFDGSGNLSIATTKNHTHPIDEITWAGGQNLTPTATANGQEWSIDLNPGSYTGTYWHVWSKPKSATILGCYPDDRHVTMPGNLTATSTTTGTLQVTGGAGFTGTVYAGGFNGPLTGNVTGNVSGSSGSCTGNAATATKLATARTINGTSFDGSANITTANWGTARNISISDADASNTGTAVSVNGSAAVTLKLPATIKATLKGNADTATALSSNAGSSTVPIYFSGGKPVQCSTTLGVSITGNAATATTATNATNIYSSASTSKAYVLGTTTASSANHGTVYNASVYTEGTVLYGAAWNDYAEYRKDNIKEKVQQQPGRCVREIGDGTLMLTTERLQRGCEIISDTFGFAIGQDLDNGYNTPVASSGRVLAYPYESIDEFKNHIGWPVCSGPDGTVSIMTDEEEEHYPSRIIGTISEVPDYEEWGADHVKVNGRIWIRIR